MPEVAEQVQPNQPQAPVGQNRLRSYRMGFIAFLLLHIPFFAYPILRICDLFDLSLITTTLIFIPCFFGPTFGWIYLRRRQGEYLKYIRRGLSTWLGTSPLLLISLLIFEAINLISPLTNSTMALGVIGLTLCLVAFSFYGALYPRIKTIKLTSSKLTKPLKFAQITDVHIGSRSKEFLSSIVKKINRLDPDFLCITGDFIDARNVGLEQLQSLREVKAPIYYVIGNHERYEDFDDILTRLGQLDFNILRNRSLTLETGIQIIGIDDSDDHAYVANELDKLNIDDDKYVILLFHRPRGFEDAADRGVDLMLCGHTHGGQIFPFNLIVRQVFDKVLGLFRHHDAHLYVSPGTGTWGPVMRFGTRSEISHFEISPSS